MVSDNKSRTLSAIFCYIKFHILYCIVCKGTIVHNGNIIYYIPQYVRVPPHTLLNMKSLHSTVWDPYTLLNIEKQKCYGRKIVTGTDFPSFLLELFIYLFIDTIYISIRIAKAHEIGIIQFFF